MGRKPKFKSNPALAKPHAAGAPICVMQELVHAQYGPIAYRWPQHWAFEIHLADESCDRLAALHLEVLELPLNASNMRNIFDIDFLEDIYCAGTDMVSHAIRAIQHLGERMEREMGSELKAATAMERIKEATSFFGINDYSEHASYQGFVELLPIRDAIEHPRAANIYGVGNDWDKVPLAWMLSERGLQAYERFRTWFDLLVTDWESYCTAHAQPTTLNIVERGIESTLQSKKPKK
ncbi:MAG: hypothetical protein ACYC06_11110 [Ilumatobacteraceae bacterium]